MRILALVLAVSWIACAEPADDVDGADLAITGGTTSGSCTGCSIIGYRVGAATTIHAGIMVAPGLVLTSKRWLTSSTAPASVVLTNAPNLVTAIVIHPTKDAALLRLGSWFAGFGAILPLDTRSMSELPGGRARCYGWDAAGSLHAITVGITDVVSGGFETGDVGLGFFSPAMFAPDVYADSGAPCTDPTTWTVLGVTTAAVQPWSGDPYALHVGAERLSEWIADQRHLTEVMATRGPVAIFVTGAAGAHQCIDVADASISNGAAVNRFPCHGGLDQTWYLADSSIAGYATFVSANSGKCIDVPNGTTAPDTGLQQYTCGNGSPNQAWASSFFAPGIKFTVRSSSPSLASQLCLTASSSGRLTQAACTGAAEQRWFQWVNPSPASHP